ncbi:hypothetical protein N9N67_12545 [Bacteriovoracaceae bacterium]|nr:hypothetical protein [Bacteriovoracaceae bacterium]
MIEFSFHSNDLSLVTHFYCDVLGYELQLPVCKKEVKLNAPGLPQINIQHRDDIDYFMDESFSINFHMTVGQLDDIKANFELFQFKHDLMYPGQQEEMFDPDGRKINLIQIEN